jgi:hypothetical protein
MFRENCISLSQSKAFHILDLFDKRIIIVITYTTLQLVLHSLRDVLGSNQLNVGKSLVKHSAMTTISKQITV